MKLRIRRSTFTNVSTVGELFIDDKFECYTLEDVVRPDGAKVYGETAIPPGRYDVRLTMSPRFKRVLPLLINVSNFVGVRIHPGNSASDTEGCILVGQSKDENWVGASKAAFDVLFPKLQAAAERGESISLDIS